MNASHTKVWGRHAGLSLMGGIAFALALASLAFACTAVQNNSWTIIESITWNNPQSATKCVGWGDCAMVGDEITVSGSVTSSGQGKDRDFMLHFLNRDEWDDTHNICMGAIQGGQPGDPFLELPGPDTIIGGPKHSDASTGAIPSTKGIIPGPVDTTSTGVARVCFIELTPSLDSVNIPYFGAATRPDSLEIVLL